MIDCNENENNNGKIDQINKKYIGQDNYIDKYRKYRVSVRQCLSVISNTKQHLRLNLLRRIATLRLS